MRHLVAPGVVLCVLWAVALSVGPLSDTSISDLYLYSVYAGYLHDGLIPYRDFGFEYPPLALAPMWLPSVPSPDRTAYDACASMLLLLAALVVMVLTARLAEAAGGNGRVAAWLVALSPLLCGALLRTHFDMLVVALLLGGLLAVVHERPLLGFSLLGAGAMTKLFPALAAVVAVAWLLGQGRRREALLGAASFLAVCALVSAPFAGKGYVDAYTFHLDRPVQIESTPASVLLIAGGSRVTGDPIRPDRFKSNGLDGGAADTVQAVFLALELVVLAWIVASAARGGGGARELVLASFAALLAFVALGKVLSPQYFVWLIPFAALAWVWGRRPAALCCAAAASLTLIEFPGRYWDLVSGDDRLIGLIAVRNGLLLAALVTLLAPRRAPARWRPPAAAPSPG